MLEGVVVKGPMGSRYHEVLTPDALAFLADLHRVFSRRIDALLETRRVRQAAYDAGEMPRFLPATAAIREGDWTVAPLPDALQVRRVEITGPVERKMVINALNSGADVFMADFEDSTAPTWDNLVSGQVNLVDAVRGTITHADPTKDKVYRLGPSPALLMVRPRGLHLPEKHLSVDGKAIPASLFDFGLFVFHNAAALVAKGHGPCFYLPKLESHLEARLWNDVFVHAQGALGLPLRTIKATVLVETLPAAFEMDEILYELRDHSAGLNCGRWDYIFSCIKTWRADPTRVLPDRGQVGMTQPFMRAYTQLVVRTCHRRGVHAIGGMAAQIPIKRDAALNDAALSKVRADKLREATDGHDGTWVAHPGLVSVALEAFPAGHQLDRLREDVHVTAEDLLTPPTGTRTEAGLRLNVRVGVQYLEAWLRGVGCVPLYDLMEDAATAEISRAQVWQWVRHGATLDNGLPITATLVRAVLEDELAGLRTTLGAEVFDGGRFGDAASLFERLATSDEMTPFLTLPAYELLLTHSLSPRRPR